MDNSKLVTGVVVGVATLGIAGYAISLQDSGHILVPRDRLASALVSNFEPTEESIAAGKILFHDGNCVKCHRADGQGGKRAPNLTDSEWKFSDGSFEGVRRTIALGVPEDKIGDEYPFQMYPMGKMAVNHDQFNALASYVWSLSRQ